MHGVCMKNFYVFLAFVLVSFLFYFLPETDIWFSRFFFTLEEHFLYGDLLWVRSLYAAGSNAPFVLIPLFILVILLGTRFKWFEQKRRLTVFALLVLIVGPGLIVNVIFKEHWDRARPRNVVEFEGDRDFSPAWVISDQCESNCSFVSGHASMGFYAMILGWLLASRSWLLAGIIFGFLMSMVRIIQGGHFLSDVLLAGFIVYFVIVFFARYLKIPDPK